MLLPPKTQYNNPQVFSDPSSIASKKVVQFRLPANFGNDDEDGKDEDEREKQKRKSESLIQTSSVKSFLLTVPKPNISMTLGALTSASGLSRRSMLEAIDFCGFFFFFVDGRFVYCGVLRDLLCSCNDAVGWAVTVEGVWLQFDFYIF